MLTRVRKNVTAPESELYFEDFDAGETFKYGSRTLTAEDIVTFAETYDPQRFHLGQESAADTMFGELVASGLQTLCVCCQMAVDGLFARTAVMAGIGFDRIRYPRPVKPGDELSGYVEVVSTECTDRHPQSGRIDFEIVGLNGDGETVMTCLNLALVHRRKGDC